jgi:hypothetical protein
VVVVQLPDWVNSYVFVSCTVLWRTTGWRLLAWGLLARAADAPEGRKGLTYEGRVVALRGSAEHDTAIRYMYRGALSANLAVVENAVLDAVTADLFGAVSERTQGAAQSRLPSPAV